MTKILKSGILGDEDRLKDLIGKVDLLKLGHHGYEYSNTEDYINVLNPEYAVITNDIGKAYNVTLKWMENRNVNYLYTTTDETEIAATITENEVYLGLKTTGCVKKINGELCYIPKGTEYKDYTKIKYRVKYEEKKIDVSSWNELKQVIEENKNEIAKIDDEAKTCTLYKLILNLKSDGDWTATSTIEIEEQQDIVLNTTKPIVMLRSEDIKEEPIFLINGNLSIGSNDMKIPTPLIVILLSLIMH